MVYQRQIRCTVLDLEFKRGSKMTKTNEAKKMLRGRRIAAIAAGGLSLALASLPGAALAQDTQTSWEGFADTTVSTTQCLTVENATPIQTHVSIYRPKILSTDTPTILSFPNVRGIIALENTSESTAPQMNGSGNYAALTLTSKADPIFYTGTYSFVVTPAPVTAATNVVGITGTINNFSNVPGCTITIDARYIRRFN